MAETNLQIIKNAMLSIGAIGIRQTPTTHDADVCLKRLSSIVRALPGWLQWNEIEVNQDYTAGDDERIAVVGDVSVTITLPQMVYFEPEIYFESDGLTVKTGVYFKAPRDGARVQVAAQQGTDKAFYAYRSDTQKWVQVHDLALDGDVPLNEAAHAALEAYLAVKIAPFYGVSVSQELANDYREAQATMWAMYGNRFKPSSPVDLEEDAGLYY